MCCGLTLLANKPHAAARSLPPSGTGDRIGRVKLRKHLGRDEGSLTGKAKAMCTSKAKQGIHSLLPMGRLVFSHLRESRAPSHMTVTWEDKGHRSELPPSFFTQLYMLSMMAYGMEYLFGRQLSWLWPLPAFCTRLACWWSGLRCRRGLLSV